VTPGEVKNHKFALDNTKSGFSCARVFGITTDYNENNIKYLLSILNSKLIKFYLQSFAPVKQGGYYTYSSGILNKVPIPSNNKDLQELAVEKVSEINRLNELFYNILNNSYEVIKAKFKKIKMSKNINNFFEIDFPVFINEIERQKIRLDINQIESLNSWFLEKKNKLIDLKNEIKIIDNKIDDIIYKAFNLTQDEIKLIKNI
ncbi:unnamed protein product, partial [marine sediment metagenome]